MSLRTLSNSNKQRSPAKGAGGGATMNISHHSSGDGHVGRTPSSLSQGGGGGGTSSTIKATTLPSLNSPLANTYNNNGGVVSSPSTHGQQINQRRAMTPTFSSTVTTTYYNSHASVVSSGGYELQQQGGGYPPMSSAPSSPTPLFMSSLSSQQGHFQGAGATATTNSGGGLSSSPSGATAAALNNGNGNGPIGNGMGLFSGRSLAQQRGMLSKVMPPPLPSIRASSRVVGGTSHSSSSPQRGGGALGGVGADSTGPSFAAGVLPSNASRYGLSGGTAAAGSQAAAEGGESATSHPRYASLAATVEALASGSWGLGGGGGGLSKDSSGNGFRNNNNTSGASNLLPFLLNSLLSTDGAPLSMTEAEKGRKLSITERAEALAASLGRDLLTLQRFIDTKHNTAKARMNAASATLTSQKLVTTGTADISNKGDGLVSSRSSSPLITAALSSSPLLAKVASGGLSGSILGGSRKPPTTPNSTKKKATGGGSPPGGGKGGGLQQLDASIIANGKRTSSPMAGSKSPANAAMISSNKKGLSPLTAMSMGGNAEVSGNTYTFASGAGAGSSPSPPSVGSAPTAAQSPYTIVSHTLALRHAEQTLIDLKAAQTSASTILRKAITATTSNDNGGALTSSSLGGGGGKRLSSSVPFAPSLSFTINNNSASNTGRPLFDANTVGRRGEGVDDGAGSAASVALVGPDLMVPLFDALLVLDRIVSISSLLSQKAQELVSLIPPSKQWRGSEVSGGGGGGDGVTTSLSAMASAGSIIATPLIALARGALTRADVAVSQSLLVKGVNDDGAAAASAADKDDYFAVTLPMVAPTAVPVAAAIAEDGLVGDTNTHIHHPQYAHAGSFAFSPSAAFEVVGTPNQQQHQHQQNQTSQYSKRRQTLSIDDEDDLYDDAVGKGGHHDVGRDREATSSSFGVGVGVPMLERLSSRVKASVGTGTGGKGPSSTTKTARGKGDADGSGGQGEGDGGLNNADTVKSGHGSSSRILLSPLSVAGGGHSSRTAAGEEVESGNRNKSKNNSNKLLKSQNQSLHHLRSHRSNTNNSVEGEGAAADADGGGHSSEGEDVADGRQRYNRSSSSTLSSSLLVASPLPLTRRLVKRLTHEINHTKINNNAEKQTIEVAGNLPSTKTTVSLSNTKKHISSSSVSAALVDSLDAPNTVDPVTFYQNASLPSYMFCSSNAAARYANLRNGSVIGGEPFPANPHTQLLSGGPTTTTTDNSSNNNGVLTKKKSNVRPSASSSLSTAATTAPPSAAVSLTGYPVTTTNTYNTALMTAPPSNPLVKRLQQQLFPSRLSLKSQCFLTDLGLISQQQQQQQNSQRSNRVGGVNSTTAASSSHTPSRSSSTYPSPLSQTQAQSLQLAVQQQATAAENLIPAGVGVGGGLDSSSTSNTAGGQRGGGASGKRGGGGGAVGGGSSPSRGAGDASSVPSTPPTASGGSRSATAGGGSAVGFASTAFSSSLTFAPPFSVGPSVVVPPLVPPVDLYGNYGVTVESLGNMSDVLETIADYCLTLQDEHALMERRMAMTRAQLAKREGQIDLELTAHAEEAKAWAEREAKLIAELASAKSCLASLASKEAGKSSTSGGGGALPNTSETTTLPGSTAKKTRESQDADAGSTSQPQPAVNNNHSSPSVSSSPPSQRKGALSPTRSFASRTPPPPLSGQQQGQLLPYEGGMNEDDHLTYQRKIKQLEQRLAVYEDQIERNKAEVKSDERELQKAQSRCADLEAEVSKLIRRVATEQQEHSIARQQIEDITQLRKEEAKMCAMAVKHLEERMADAKEANDTLQRRLDLLSANFKTLFEGWVLSDARGEELSQEADALGRELGLYRSLFNPALAIHLEAMQERYLTTLCRLDESQGTVACLRQELDHVNLQRKLALNDTREFVDNLRKSTEWKLILARLPEEASHFDQKTTHLSADRDRRIVDINLQLQTKAQEFAAKVKAEQEERRTYREKIYREEDTYWQSNGCEEMRRAPAHSLTAAFYQALPNALTDLSEFCQFSRTQSQAVEKYKNTKHPAILQGSQALSDTLAAVVLMTLGAGGNNADNLPQTVSSITSDDGNGKGFTSRASATTTTSRGGLLQQQQAKTWRVAAAAAAAQQQQQPTVGNGATSSGVSSSSPPSAAVDALRDPNMIKAFVNAAMLKETTFSDFVKEQAAARAME